MIGRISLLATTALVASIGAAAAQRPSLSHAGGYVHRFVSTTPRGAQTLYDQNENDAGYAVFSDYYDSGGSDSQAADDFAVPAGFTWIVQKIDVTGVYFNGSGPSVGQKVYFYKDKNGKPGKLIQEIDNLQGVDSGGSFAITLPGKGVKLKTGKYWLSVQVGLHSFAQDGEWGWEVSSGQNASGTMWRNPGEASACARPGPRSQAASASTSAPISCSTSRARRKASPRIDPAIRRSVRRSRRGKIYFRSCLAPELGHSARRGAPDAR